MILNIDGVDCEVEYIYGGYARASDGRCAYCHGDPHGIKSSINSPISQFYMKNPDAVTCPCCEEL